MTLWDKTITTVVSCNDSDKIREEDISMRWLTFYIKRFQGVEDWFIPCHTDALCYKVFIL